MNNIIVIGYIGNNCEFLEFAPYKSGVTGEILSNIIHNSVHLAKARHRYPISARARGLVL